VAHRRKPLTVALGLNTVVFVVEVAGGIQASSLSLVIDGVHNLSDEVALGFLVLASAMGTGLSSRLLRTANLFNSVGLLAICVSYSGESSNASRSRCRWGASSP